MILSFEGSGIACCLLSQCWDERGRKEILLIFELIDAKSVQESEYLLNDMCVTCKVRLNVSWFWLRKIPGHSYLWKCGGRVSWFLFVCLLSQIISGLWEHFLLLSCIRHYLKWCLSLKDLNPCLSSVCWLLQRWDSFPVLQLCHTKQRYLSSKSESVYVVWKTGDFDSHICSSACIIAKLATLS